jgi:hypothetical protein
LRRVKTRVPRRPPLSSFDPPHVSANVALFPFAKSVSTMPLSVIPLEPASLPGDHIGGAAALHFGAAIRPSQQTKLHLSGLGPSHTDWQKLRSTRSGNASICPAPTGGRQRKYLLASATRRGGPTDEEKQSHYGNAEPQSRNILRQKWGSNLRLIRWPTHVAEAEGKTKRAHAGGHALIRRLRQRGAAPRRTLSRSCLAPSSLR